MISVRIFINQDQIAQYDAIRIKGNTGPKTINTYLMDGTEDTIKHRYGDGAEKLALKMLWWAIRRKENAKRKE